MNSVLVKLRIMFAFLGILVVIFALLHEGNFLVTGHWAGNIEILYWANTFSILLTIGGIYLAVKLLSVKKIHRRFFKKKPAKARRVEPTLLQMAGIDGQARQFAPFCMSLKTCGNKSTGRWHAQDKRYLTISCWCGRDSVPSYAKGDVDNPAG